jgi:hypothetical protein
VKTFSHFFECVGPAEDQRQQPRIWLRGLAKVRAEFSLSARGYHLRRGLNLGSVADLLKALGVAGNRAAPFPACGTRPRFFMKANPPRSRKSWPDRNDPQFRNPEPRSRWMSSPVRSRCRRSFHSLCHAGFNDDGTGNFREVLVVRRVKQAA